MLCVYVCFTMIVSLYVLYVCVIVVFPLPSRRLAGAQLRAGRQLLIIYIYIYIYIYTYNIDIYRERERCI